MTDCSQQFLFPPDDKGSQERLNELVSPSTRFTSTTSSYQSQNALLEDKAILLDQYDKLDKQEALENKKQNRELRKDFAYKAYEIACGCLLFWIVIVCLSAIVSFVTGRVFLSDTALGIVTTGVTVNVFAALLTVIKGLFSKEGD
ncbi:hypothetical protein [Neisseria sp.]